MRTVYLYSTFYWQLLIIVVTAVLIMMKSARLLNEDSRSCFCWHVSGSSLAMAETWLWAIRDFAVLGPTLVDSNAAIEL